MVGVYVFIVEGLVSFLLIFVWWPMISEHPADAKWISKEEREYLEEKLSKEQAELNQETGSKASLKTILGSLNMWKLILIYFCYQTGIYGFAMWLPTILRNLTSSGMTGIGFLQHFLILHVLQVCIFLAICLIRAGTVKICSLTVVRVCCLLLSVCIFTRVYLGVLCLPCRLRLVFTVCIRYLLDDSDYAVPC